MIDRGKLRNLIYAMDGDVADLPFWEGCERGEFLLHQCGKCGRHYWPAAHCVDHGGEAMRWVPSSGRGTVHVHTIMRRGKSGASGEAAPYNVAVIQLEEGPFFHSNVVDCPPDDMRTGLPVRAEFTTHENGMTVPVFRRRDDGED